MAVAGGRRARGGGGGLQPWPGYVDALSTLLMVLIFVLLVFVLAQGFLSVALSSRDRALDRLNRQVAELAEMLALERGQAQELRGTLARANEELRAAASARDLLIAEVREARDARDRLGGERDGAVAERDRLAVRVADLELAGRGGAERLATLEAQLAEALQRAEATGADTAQTVRRLTEATRSLAAEQAARGQAEARAAELERQVAEQRGAAEAQRQEAAGLARQTQEAQRQLSTLRQEMAAAGRSASEAQAAEAARLVEQIRALTALRDQLERQVREADARSAQQDKARQLAERTAAEQAEARRTAEATAREATRLGESARAQVALLTREVEELRRQLARVAGALDAAEAAGKEKDVQVANLGQRLNTALAARVEELQRYRSDFFGRLREVLGERPEVRIAGDRFVFQSEVLFAVGSAELSARGKQQVREIGKVLQELAAKIPADIGWVLQVDGHADRTRARNVTNWELAARRAIAVAELLIAEGMPPNRVAAASFGDTQPIDPGTTNEAYARNRRIELRLTDR
jgi:chemotaxis protein MotB